MSTEPRKICTNPECSFAGQPQPLSKFYRDKYTPDGHCRRCIACHKIAARQRKPTEASKARKRLYNQGEVAQNAFARYARSERGRETGRIRTVRMRQRYPEKEKARKAVSLAVRAGSIPRAKTLRCIRCGEQAKEYHHHLGYAEKHHLDVVPVCKACHVQVHLSDPD